MGTLFVALEGYSIMERLIEIKQTELNPTLRALSDAGVTVEDATWIRQSKNAALVESFIRRMRNRNPFKQSVKEQMDALGVQNEAWRALGMPTVSDEDLTRLANTAPVWPAGRDAHRSFTLRFGDVYDGVQERDVDRVVLDLPEPWRALDMVAASMKQGGILLSYLPTILQVHQLSQALARDPRFDFVESFEVLERPWYMAPTSARPVHRMVAHTGFMVRTLLCAPRRGFQPPAPESETSRGAEVDAEESLGALGEGQDTGLSSR